MTFRFGQVRNKRFNEHSTFPLSHKRGSCCADCFRTGNFHCPKEEVGKFDDDPLQDSPVVEKLHDGDEEDYCGDDTDEEPTLIMALAGGDLGMGGYPLWARWG